MKYIGSEMLKRLVLRCISWKDIADDIYHVDRSLHC